MCQINTHPIIIYIFLMKTVILWTSMAILFLLKILQDIYRINIRKEVH